MKKAHVAVATWKLQLCVDALRQQAAHYTGPHNAIKLAGQLERAMMKADAKHEIKLKETVG
jgi:hypothetical protein